MATKPQSTSAADAQLPHDQIAARARKLWEDRGRPGGRDLEHWLDAERQLRDELSRRGNGGGTARSGKDLVEAEKRLDGLIEPKSSPARRTPKGEQL